MQMKRRWHLPASVVGVVKALCADYDRRESEIGLCRLPGEVLTGYVRFNAIIDRALAEVDPGIRRELFADIQQGRGYSLSAASPFIAKNTYYLRKRKLVYDIAVGFGLI